MISMHMLSAACMAAMLVLVGCDTNQGSKQASQSSAPTNDASTAAGDVTTTTGSAQNSVGNIPANAVRFNITGSKIGAVLFGKREIRLYFEGGEAALTHAAGTLTIPAETTETVQLYSSVPPGEYLAASARNDIALPAVILADMTFGLRAGGSATFTLPQTAVVATSDSNQPQITSAGLNQKIGGDTALFAVFGKNLENSRVFFRSGETEYEVPLDVATDTEAGMLDSSLQDLLKPGEWDVIVRTKHGEAVLPKGIKKD